LGRSFSKAARGWVVAADVLLAPELLSLEAWRADTARRAQRLGAHRERLHRASTSLACTALELGTELDHPVYDCVYMALPEADGAAFLTADRKLVDLVLANRPSLRAYWVAQEISKVH
jgi:predicted nucleic acid-binding protein